MLFNPVKVMQEQLNFFLNDYLVVDGIIGPRTIGAIERMLGGMQIRFERLTEEPEMMALEVLNILKTVYHEYLQTESELYLMHLHAEGNTPYIWGGQSLRGFDCSGIVVHIRRLFYNAPEDMSAQALYDEPKARLTKELLFFGDNKHAVKHVMLELGQTHLIGMSGGGRDNKEVEFSVYKDARLKIKRRHYRSDKLDWKAII